MSWPSATITRGTYQWLQRELALKMGFSPDVSLLDHTRLGVLDSIIESGMDRFYYPPPGEFNLPDATEAQKERLRRAPYAWSFLQEITSISTVAAQSSYSLPADFSSFIGEPTTTENGRRIAIVNEGHIRQLIASEALTGSPSYAALRTNTGDGSAKPTHSLLLYPIPEGVEAIQVQHSISAPTLSAANPYPLAGLEHAETILACCLAVIEEREGGDGVAFRNMMNRLATSISIDQLVAQSTADGVWPDDGEDLGYGRAFLEKSVGLKLGIGPNPKAWTHAQSKKINDRLRYAMRMVVNPPVLPGERYPHEWTWLKPVTTLTTIVDQSTYDLPTDFANVEGPLIHAPGQFAVYNPVQVVGEHLVREKLQGTDLSGRPQIAGIRIKNPYDADTGSRYEIVLWPTPDDEYELTYQYRINPETIIE